MNGRLAARGVWLSLVCLAAALCARTPARAAGDWPCWRGATGCGNSDEKNLPLTWNAQDNTNVLWKAELPKADGLNPSSPIVVGDSVVVTTSSDKPALEHHVACYGKTDGAPRWVKDVPAGPLEKIDPRGGSSAPTPCSDGKRVFMLLGTCAIVALDLSDGQIRWRHDLPETAFDVALGTSPMIHGDTVILVADQNQGKSAIYGWDCSTGAPKFEEKRPGETFCHSTPIFVKVDGKDQMIYAGNKAAQGLDPDTGKVLWWATWPSPQGWMGESSSPAWGGGKIYIDNGRGDGGVALVPGDSGDVSKTNVKATFAIKSDIGSPIVVGDCVYRNSGDRVQCMKLETGEILYSEKLAGIQPWASPVATADRVYYATAGKSYVLKAGPAFEILGQGDLNDASPASPAISDGKLYFKGAKYLWCVTAGK